VAQAHNQALRLALKEDVSLFFRHIRIRTVCKQFPNTESNIQMTPLSAADFAFQVAYSY